MPVGLPDIPELMPVEGIRLSAFRAGLYKKNRKDLALIACDHETAFAAVFTRNAFCAAPVRVARLHLKSGNPALCIINAGNANAGTGLQGYQDALTICHATADIQGCTPEAILPFSTGVIGEPLPVNKICNVLPDLFDALSENAWLDMARAIMTTDTVPKGISRIVNIDGKSVTITGVVKGAGMIRPDMATMLAFIATDATVDKSLLQSLLEEAVEMSFNRVSVDGDTSTNDACVLMATGKSSAAPVTRDKKNAVGLFRQALEEVCLYLAQALVRDGEGVTKFVTLDIRGGRDREECLSVAEAIAHSPLVKTALYASDPNWGRILAAIGRSPVKELDVSRVDIFLHNVCIVRNGERDAEYTEAQGRKVFAGDEITVSVHLHRGDHSLSFWTSDLSYEYVRINAEYRS